MDLSNFDKRWSDNFVSFLSYYYCSYDFLNSYCYLFNFAEEHSCSVDGDACLDTKNSQGERGHGHYFCCCKGDLCNENFKAAPPKAEPIKPQKPAEPKKESDNMTAVVICIAVVLVFVIGAVSFFIVSMINENYWLNT